MQLAIIQFAAGGAARAAAALWAAAPRAMMWGRIMLQSSLHVEVGIRQLNCGIPCLGFCLKIPDLQQAAYSKKGCNDDQDCTNNDDRQYTCMSINPSAYTL